MSLRVERLRIKGFELRAKGPKHYGLQVRLLKVRVKGFRLRIRGLGLRLRVQGILGLRLRAKG